MADRVILFVCVENACRSLMAEAMFNAAPPAGWHAVSAGTRPAPAPNPRTESMLREIGLSLPLHPPQQLTPEMMDGAGVRVTLGCLDDASCPARLRTQPVQDWALPDPAQLDDRDFRRVREALAVRVAGLTRKLSRSDRRRTAPPRGTSE